MQKGSLAGVCAEKPKSCLVCTHTCCRIRAMSYSVVRYRRIISPIRLCRGKRSVLLTYNCYAYNYEAPYSTQCYISFCFVVFVVCVYYYCYYYYYYYYHYYYYFAFYSLLYQFCFIFRFLFYMLYFTFVI